MIKVTHSTDGILDFSSLMKKASEMEPYFLWHGQACSIEEMSWKSEINYG
jgi:hypothetical protein